MLPVRAWSSSTLRLNTQRNIYRIQAQASDPWDQQLNFVNGMTDALSSMNYGESYPCSRALRIFFQGLVSCSSHSEWAIPPGGGTSTAWCTVTTLTSKTPSPSVWLGLILTKPSQEISSKWICLIVLSSQDIRRQNLPCLCRRMHILVECQLSIFTNILYFRQTAISLDPHVGVPLLKEVRPVNPVLLQIRSLEALFQYRHHCASDKIQGSFSCVNLLFVFAPCLWWHSQVYIRMIGGDRLFCISRHNEICLFDLEPERAEHAKARNLDFNGPICYPSWCHSSGYCVDVSFRRLYFDGNYRQIMRTKRRILGVIIPVSKEKSLIIIKLSDFRFPPQYICLVFDTRGVHGSGETNIGSGIHGRQLGRRSSVEAKAWNTNRITITDHPHLIISASMNQFGLLLWTTTKSVSGTSLPSSTVCWFRLTTY